MRPAASSAAACAITSRIPERGSCVEVAESVARKRRPSADAQSLAVQKRGVIVERAELLRVGEAERAAWTVRGIRI